MIGYMLQRSGGSGRMFCGTTAEEVANVLKIELDAEEGLKADECDVLTITPVEITQEEIDALPDFPGW